MMSETPPPVTIEADARVVITGYIARAHEDVEEQKYQLQQLVAAVGTHPFNAIAGRLEMSRAALDSAKASLDLAQALADALSEENRQTS